MRKLRTGANLIPVEYHDAETLRQLYPHAVEDNEILMGLWSGVNQKILLNKDQDTPRMFNTLIHEIGEMINGEYGLEIDHPTLTSFCKAFTDILQQNSKEIKNLF